ncbi:response regulator [Candidatus Poribacteria bacterium]|nr:response regulator [Candidatus Poribacteria bacterium]
MNVDFEPGRTTNVLLIEDNPGDVRLVQEAFAECEAPCTIQVVSDGARALETIRSRAQCNGAMPNLVILDLNLPKMNGLEVLREIKQEPALRTIPVIVLTSSRDARDIRAAYDAHANAYVVKPHDFDQLARSLLAVSDFWMSTAVLPPQERRLDARSGFDKGTTG